MFYIRERGWTPIVFVCLIPFLKHFGFLIKYFKMDSMYDYHTRTIVFLFLESYLEICVCVCVCMCVKLHMNDLKSVFHTFDEKCI